MDVKRPELNDNGAPPTPPAASRATQLVGKAIAIVGGAVLLTSALALSVLFFAVLIVGGLLVGGYLWWKTRDLRKQIRTQFQSNDPFRTVPAEDIREGEIIEGEIVARGTPQDKAMGASHEHLLK